MASSFGSIARWAVLLVLGALGLAAQASAPRDQAPPTMATLPDWVRHQVKPDQVLRIAIVGCNPDVRDPRLQPDERFRLWLRDGRHAPPSETDTALVVWLRSAAPRLSLVCAPLEQEQEGDDRGAALAVAIALAARPDRDAGPDASPDVMYIPHELLRPRQAPWSEAVMQAIGECWRARCLPMTVAEPGRASAPGGLLVVSLMLRAEEPNDIVDLGKGEDMKKLAGRPIALRLPASSLEGAPRGLGDTRAAAAYLTLAAATLPAEGPLPHLERVARLGQVNPVHWAEGEAEGPYRLLDVRAGIAPAPDLKIPFIDRAVPWSTRVVDLDPKDAISIMAPGAPREEIGRRILTSVRGEARLRHLNAVAQLAGLRPIYLTHVPRRLGLAFYRLDPELEAAARQPILNLLRTLEGQTDESLFNAVGGDEPLTQPQPRE